MNLFGIKGKGTKKQLLKLLENISDDESFNYGFEFEIGNSEKQEKLISTLKSFKDVDFNINTNYKYLDVENPNIVKEKLNIEDINPQHISNFLADKFKELFNICDIPKNEKESIFYVKDEDVKLSISGNKMIVCRDKKDIKRYDIVIDDFEFNILESGLIVYDKIKDIDFAIGKYKNTELLEIDLDSNPDEFISIFEKLNFKNVKEISHLIDKRSLKDLERIQNKILRRKKKAFKSFLIGLV